MYIDNEIQQYEIKAFDAKSQILGIECENDGQIKNQDALNRLKSELSFYQDQIFKFKLRKFKANIDKLLADVEICHRDADLVSIDMLRNSHEIKNVLNELVGGYDRFMDRESE